MTSILGKKKSKQRTTSISDRSIPYDQLAQPPRSPLPVGTTSGGLSNYISAPITNPTLTSNGTELNIYTISRTKAEREKAYAEARKPASPSVSTFNGDAQSLYSDSSGKLSKKAGHQRRSEASTSGSNNYADFGHYPSSPSARPMSTRSETNRSSKYAPSFVSDSNSHLSQFYQQVSAKSHNEFHFERPRNDADIEAMFENVMRNRGDVVGLSKLPLDQKWHMVYNHEHIRWNEERSKEGQSRRQAETGHAGLTEGTPEWYIQRFMNKTVTPKQASDLQISLRSKELRYVSSLVYDSLSSSWAISQLVSALYITSRHVCAGADLDAHQQKNTSQVKDLISHTHWQLY